MSVEEKNNFEKTIAAVRKLGINPELVTLGDLDIHGYEELVLVDGKRVYDHKTNGALTVRREWPSLEAALSVLEPFLMEMHEMGEL